MFLEIITPEKRLFAGEVSLVQLPGSKSSFEILSHHADIVSTLEKGIVRLIGSDGKEITVQIGGGVMECRKNKILILADGQ
jgi:F-type H+-transporting ATPase subunit epsilon